MVSEEVGEFGEHKNRNGNSLIKSATSNDLKITNMFFIKKDINKYTGAAKGTVKLITFWHTIKLFTA